MSEREEFEAWVKDSFTTNEYSFKRDGEWGGYLCSVTSKNYFGAPSRGEWIETQSLWDTWQAGARAALLRERKENI